MFTTTGDPNVQSSPTDLNQVGLYIIIIVYSVYSIIILRGRVYGG